MLKLLIPPPVVALFVAIVIWLASLYVPALAFSFPYQSTVALVIFVVALCLDLVAIGLFMRTETTTNPMAPERSEKLVTSGSYRLTRNPMYLGLALILTSIGIWLGSWAFLPAVLVYVLYITEFQIKPEEAVLKEKFGDVYVDYCRNVRRWI